MVAGCVERQVGCGSGRDVWAAAEAVVALSAAASASRIHRGRSGRDMIWFTLGLLFERVVEADRR
jgi:hypothetical protein